MNKSEVGSLRSEVGKRMNGRGGERVKRSIGVVETVPVECLYIKLTGITTKDKLSLREARNERRSLSGGADGQSPNVNRKSEVGN